MKILLNLAQISNKCVPEKRFSIVLSLGKVHGPWQMITDEKNPRGILPVYFSACHLLIYTVMHALCPTSIFIYATNTQRKIYCSRR